MINYYKYKEGDEEKVIALSIPLLDIAPNATEVTNIDRADYLIANGVVEDNSHKIKGLCDALKRNAFTRESLICDINTKLLLARIEASGVDQSLLPKCLGKSLEWSALWNEYHIRKEAVKNGNLEVSTDFDSFGEAEYSYSELALEFETAKGS